MDMHQLLRRTDYSGSSEQAVKVYYVAEYVINTEFNKMVQYQRRLESLKQLGSLQLG